MVHFDTSNGYFKGLKLYYRLQFQKRFLVWDSLLHMSEAYICNLGPSLKIKQIHILCHWTNQPALVSYVKFCGFKHKTTKS